MAAQVALNEDALPQIIGDFAPVDVWQTHMNAVFYGLQSRVLRDLYQTFAAADYRLGYALASDYFEQVVNRQAQSPISDGSVLTVMEWGGGNGNLAASFLDRIKELDHDGAWYGRIEYVLIDAYEPVLDGARNNPDLKKHESRIRFVQAQVEDLKEFRDASVDRIFCNELWSELATKLVLRKGGDVMEEHLRPNLKETRLADFPDWPGFIKAFGEVDVGYLQTLKSFLEDIVWEREYHKIEAKEIPFRRTITEVLKQIDEEVLMPANVGAAVTLKEAQRLLAPEAIGFTSFDAGTMKQQCLNDPENPCYGLHGGQFSFMVNFPLLQEVAKQSGAQAVTVEPQREFVGRALGTNVVSLMDVLSSHPQLPEGGQWVIDRFIVQTIQAINKHYESPYERRIEFPIAPDAPAERREELVQLIQSIKSHGVPDTVAYLTEEEIDRASADLEALGYDRAGLRAALMAPPQPVDYYQFSFKPGNLRKLF